MVISERIKFYREKKNMTVNKLATTAGISQSFLREVELGLKKPTVETVSLLCDALGITLKEFFDDGLVAPSDELNDAIFRLTTEQRKRLAEFIKSMT